MAEQLEIGLPDVYRHRLLLDQMLRACRSVMERLGAKACADALDQIWGPIGHPVSASVLTNALRDHERNYFRWEWASWFAEQSDEVKEIQAEMIGKGKPKKSAEDLLEDLKSAIREEYPRQADKLIRKAEAA